MDPKLLQAATSGNIGALGEISDDNILRQVLTPINNTALHIAAKYGHLEFASMVYGRCRSLLSEENSKGDTPLIVAARAGHLNLLEVLIGFGKVSSTDVEIGRCKAHEMLIKGNKEKNTAMHEAVRNGHLQVVEFLIQEDPVLLCFINNAGESPLYLAAERPAPDIVNIILDNACYGHIGPNGRTALHAAVVRCNSVITESLLEKNKELLNVADDNKRTPLHFAATLGYYKMVEQLLKCDTSTAYHLDKYSIAPIHVAATNGYIKTPKELLRCCPEIKDLLNGKGQNILHIAVEHKCKKLVSYILKTKELEGLINEKDNSGNTPLHQATISCHPSIVNILARDRRVDKMALNNNRLTALQIAESEGYNGTDYSKALILAILSCHAWKFRICSVMEEDSSSNYFKNNINTLLVVAALITTVTFTAGFTFPKAYSEDGKEVNMTILLKNNTNFRHFVFCNNNAMFTSMIAVVLLIYMELLSGSFISSILFVVANSFLFVAIVFMVGAFWAAVKVEVFTNKGLLRDNYVYLAIFGIVCVVFLHVTFWAVMKKYLIYLDVSNPKDNTSERTDSQNPTLASMLFCYKQDDE